jgi:hypothetical protein
MQSAGIFRHFFFHQGAQSADQEVSPSSGQFFFPQGGYMEVLQVGDVHPQKYG